MFRGIADRLKDIKETFSVNVLARTLFSPWKQIQTVSTFHNFFQSAIDNLISRFIGAVIRIFMLVAALMFTVLVVVIGALFVVVWPFVPFMILVLPAMSVIGVELW